MHIAIRRAQNDCIAGARRAASAHLGDQRLIRAGAHVRIGGFAEAFDEFDRPRDFETGLWRGDEMFGPHADRHFRARAAAVTRNRRFERRKTRA